MNVLDRRAEVAAHKPQTVADLIAGTLREAISDGSLAAGSALRQDELAKRFGFSRMPIRDALRVLEAEGIVSIHPTRGAFVAKMDAAEIRDIYALRELLEVEALKRSLPHLRDAELDEASAVLDQIDVEADVGRWGALNRTFHLSLYRGCDNSRLLALIDAQLIAADRYVRILLSRMEYSDRSQTEHRELLSSCRKQEEAQACDWLATHIREGGKTLAKSIK